MKYIIIILAIIGIICFFNSKDVWEGFYYPDGCLSCAENYIYSPKFETKEQCFDWADSIKLSRGNPSDLFECGLNCKKNNGLNICEETVD